MLEIFKETTVWDTDIAVPNHTYLLDGDKIIAYAKFGSNEVVKLKSLMRINKRYRKFIKTNHKELQFIIDGLKPEKDVRTFKINSNEKEYYVKLKNNKFTCTCTGYNFRGKCKHINAVIETIGD